MVKYFTSQRRVKIKPESEIFSHITLTSAIVVYSTLDIFTALVQGLVGNSQASIVGIGICKTNQNGQLLSSSIQKLCLLGLILDLALQLVT